MARLIFVNLTVCRHGRRHAGLQAGYSSSWGWMMNFNLISFLTEEQL
ncbi:hypothetical protein [Ureibacillus aquaedulcis]|uniref:Uncharacterized protein n=1 Tax=Ureibacillus aquaedulcis TaxID=3058421 RepID=A0ABT8GQZ7_9BACL|nr:hypothetical protein [Ureibacillus sp. BA0131]MDN4493837.1 hypothetical protein [Ureibacillus sp. BA0131]